MADLFVLTLEGARLTWGAPEGAAAVDAVAVAHSLTPAPLSVVSEGRTATGTTVSFGTGLAEETGYPVLLQSLGGEPVALVHSDPVVTAGLTVSDQGRAVHGRLTMGAHAGQTRFAVWVGARPVAEVALAVHPTKVPWASVEAMRADVEAAGAGLSVAALRPTTSTATAAGAGTPPVVPGWLMVAEAGVEAVEQALTAVARRPAAETARTVVPLRLSAVGRSASPETRRALARAGTPAERVPARPPQPTLDTPAHRWLAAAVARARRTARRLAGEEGQRPPSLRRDAVRMRLERLAARLDRLERHSLLVYADRHRAPLVPPRVLRERSAYAEAYGALRRLDTGLLLRGGALDVAWQDLAVLYETWTALAVVRAAAAATGDSGPQRPFGVDVVGTRVVLRSGQRHRVGLDGPRGRVEIVRGPLFAGPAGQPPLLRQRPDLYVVLTPPGGRSRRIVLDAKYRLDARPSTVRRYGTPAPPADAIGTLHRYRDAIRGPSGAAGWIDEAVALFPSDAEAWRTGRLWVSIAQAGVGAVGLLPGHEAPLQALFERWLG